MRDFDRRVAVVTGSASGIGRATSELLASKGCDLALVDRDEEGMAATAERVRAVGRKVSLHRIDVANKEQMAALPERVVRAHDHVHIVVNNAGVSLAGTLAEVTLEDIEWIVGINLWGVLYGCKFFLPYLQREDQAHIVNLSSMLGFLGIPGQAPYCLTKSAVRAFSESLYAELSIAGIGVTSVHPGTIRTNIVRSARFYDEKQKQTVVAQMDRFGISPERVARKIVHAIEHNKVRVIVGPDAHAAEWLKRLLPVTSHRVAAWVYGRAFRS